MKLSFSKGIKAIRKNKFLFIILIVLHILFIATTLLIVIKTQSAVLEDLETIINKANQANFDADSIQAGQPFLAEAAQIQALYSSFKERLTDAYTSLGGLIILGNTIIWIVSFRFFEKRVNRRVLKIFSSYLVGFGLLTLWGYLLIRQYFPEQISQNALISIAKLFAIGFIVIAYFVLIATMNSHKKWTKLLFKPWSMLIPYTIAAVSIGIGSWIMYIVTNSMIYANWLPWIFVMFTILLSYLRIFIIENAHNT
jgi:hypothetical protein